MGRRAGYDDRRTSIIEAALGVLVEEGYEACTVERVITAAGISKGTFYHYFPTKEALVEAGLLTATGGIADEAISAASTGGDPLRRLDALLGLVRPWRSAQGPADSALARILLQTQVLEALRTRAFSSLTGLLTPPLTAVLDAGVREGRFQVGDTAVTAEMIVLLALSTRARVIALPFTDQPRPERAATAARWVGAFLTVVERTLGLPASALGRDDPAEIERSMA